MSNQVKNHIVIGRESTYGTPVTPTKTLPVNFTGGIQTQNDVQMVTSLKSRLARNDDSFIGNRTHEGDYEIASYMDWIGYLFLSAFGQDTVTEPEAGVVYKHDFAEAEVKPSLTIEQKIGENIRRFAGAIVHTLTISGAPGEMVMVNPSIKAQSQAFQGSPVTPAPTATPPLNFANAVLKVDGVALTEIQNFSFEFTNGADLKHVIGQQDPEYVFLNGHEISGSFEGYLDATTLAAFVDKYLNKEEVELELVVTGSDTIGAGSNYELEILVPKAVFTAVETPLGDGYNIFTAEFSGIYDPVTGKLASAYLTNLTPDYL